MQHPISGFDDIFNLLEDQIWGPELEPGDYEVKVVLDPSNTIEETNEDNNEYTEIIHISE